MAENYLRVCRIQAGGQTIILDDMQVEFSVRQARVQTPAIAVIRLINLADVTRNLLCVEKQRVVLEAGYRDHYGVIFAGQVMQGNRGKIGGTDTYADLYCADSDQAYIQGRVSTTLPKGSTRQQVIDECLKAWAPYGVTKGFMSPKLGGFKYPQPVVLFGLAREIMRGVAKDVGADWSFANGKLNLIHKTEALPGGEIVLNSETGLVGRATQTFGGIIARAKLNPAVRKDCIVRIDEASIDRAAPDPSFGFQTPQNAKIPSIAADGRYKVYGIDRTGSMRGPEWDDMLYCASATDGTSFLPQALRDFRQ